MHESRGVCGGFEWPKRSVGIVPAPVAIGEQRRLVRGHVIAGDVSDVDDCAAQQPFGKVAQAAPLQFDRPGTQSARRERGEVLFDELEHWASLTRPLARVELLVNGFEVGDLHARVDLG